MIRAKKRDTAKNRTKPSRKLRLNKETLKDLSAADPRRIKGGCAGGTNIGGCDCGTM